jgi:hypothetical protein
MLCDELDVQFSKITDFINGSGKSLWYEDFYYPDDIVNGLVLDEFNILEPEKSLKQLINSLTNLKLLVDAGHKKQLAIFNQRAKYDVRPEVKKIFNNNFKNVNKNNLNYETFYIMLSVLWAVSINKNDYKTYYQTLNTVLSDEFKVVIPEKYEDIMFTIEEIEYSHTELSEENIFFKELVKLASASEVTIEDYSSVWIEGVDLPYSDCMETTVRNFVKILIFDDRIGLFSIDKLRGLGANDDIIEFFTVFNTDAKHTTIKKQLFKGEEHTAREAWAIIVSNKPGIRYKKLNGEFNYELKNGHGIEIRENNLLNIIKYLFANIKTWDDLVDMGFITNLEVNLAENFEGTIKFDSYVLTTQIYDDTIAHSYIKKAINSVPCKRKDIIDKYRSYFDILTTNEQYSKYNDYDNWMLYVKYNNDTIIYIINFIYYHTQNVDFKFYTAIVNKFLEVSQANELSLIKILYKYIPAPNIKIMTKSMKDYSKFTNLENLDIRFDDQVRDENNQIMYNEEGKQIVENKYFAFSSVKNNTKLEKISIYRSLVIVPFFDSLFKLNNLKELSVDEYNFPLGNSLKNLINLEILSLRSYNFPLDNSLEKLINLKQLILASYDFPLGNSLENLINLEELSLASYNHPLGDSLKNLTNLKVLSLYAYDQPLANPFETLTNLTMLALSTYNYPLDDSLKNLTNLNRLFLDTYNYPLQEPLNYLKNLEWLEMTSYKHKNYVKELMKIKGVRLHPGNVYVPSSDEDDYDGYDDYNYYDRYY